MKEDVQIEWLRDLHLNQHHIRGQGFYAHGEPFTIY
jgi:hypothetical protein